MSKVLLFFGIFFLVVAMGYTGVLGSGDRIRANYTNEGSEDRQRRYKYAGILFLGGILCLGIRYLLYGI